MFLFYLLPLALYAKPQYGDVIDEVGHVLGVNFPQTDGEPFPLPTQLNTWEKFIPVEGSLCMGSEETGVWIRQGRDEDKLMVYFQEGGGCFNLITCGTAYSNPTGFSGNGNPGYSGAFDPNDSRNAWKDYSIVFIPYCSGDVHFGNFKSTPPLSGLREFRGRANLNLVMQRLVPTFPKTKDLVVTGESAGGFGALANFDFVLLGWPNLESRTLVDDSGPIFHDKYLATCLQRQMRDLWGITDTMPPDCPQCTNSEGGGLFEIYEFLQKKYPQAKLALINAVNDAVISFFFGFSNNDNQCNALLPGLLPVFEEGIRNASETFFGPRFATMLFPGSAHTFLTRNSFFSEQHDGVLLHDWLTQLMNGVFLKVNPWDGLYGEQYYNMTKKHY